MINNARNLMLMYFWQATQNFSLVHKHRKGEGSGKRETNLARFLHIMVETRNTSTMHTRTYRILQNKQPICIHSNVQIWKRKEKKQVKSFRVLKYVFCIEGNKLLNPVSDWWLFSLFAFVRYIIISSRWSTYYRSKFFIFSGIVFFLKGQYYWQYYLALLLKVVFQFMIIYADYALTYSTEIHTTYVFTW